MADPGNRPPPIDRGAAPRWHAPPPPRGAPRDAPPTATPPPSMAPRAPAPPPRPPVPWPERMAPPLLGALLLLVAALAAWPALRAVVAPAPAPTAPASPTLARPVQPQGSQTVGCFGTLTLAPASGATTVDRDTAEVRVRDLVELPSVPGRLGSLIDARPVTLDYRPTPFGAPVIQATQAAAVRGRAAWLLSFVRTPPLEAPLDPPTGDTAYFLYALVDAATGGVLQVCGQAGTGAEVDGQPLPAVPPERLRRQSLAAAQAAVPFPVRRAAWLPFTPLADHARVDRLPGGHAEIVADYFATGGTAVGARVRLISTDAPPPLATTGRGGTPVPLAAGDDARFDDLGTAQALTWREGATWYQVVAARPPGDGAPYTRDDLLHIAAPAR